MYNPNQDPSFNPHKLAWLEFEMDQELEMIEEGSTPDGIVQARNFVAEVVADGQKFRESVGNDILARYGVQEHDQLPAAGLIEYAEAHARWMKE